MNILMISPFYAPNIGGVETHLTDLTGYLVNKNHHVSVLTYQPLTTKLSGKHIETRKNLYIKRVRWFGKNLFHRLEKYPILEFIYLTPRLFLTSFLFMLKNRKRVDVIHAHGMNGAFIAKFISKFFKKRAVVSLHAIYNFKENSKTNFIYKWVLKSFDKILTLSQASKKDLEKLGISVNSVQLYIYWINQKIFKKLDKNQCRKNLGLGPNFIVLFVGRLIDIKGTDILIQVAKEVNKKITFIFIGTGPEEEKIRKESEKNKNIVFVGSVENEKLAPYYNAADILVIPSKYEEGFGRVILEALSCGTPVVGSKIGGIPEAVTEEVGILVGPTSENFKKAILDLFENRKKLNWLAKNCRKYSESKFGESNAKIIEKSYSS